MTSPIESGFRLMAFLFAVAIGTCDAVLCFLLLRNCIDIGKLEVPEKRKPMLVAHVSSMQHV